MENSNGHETAVALVVSQRKSPKNNLEKNRTSTTQQPIRTSKYILFLYADEATMKKVHILEAPDTQVPPQHDRRFAGMEEVVHSQTIKPLRHLSFDTISSIQFCVDGARGLPASVTGTRVTARLLSHDRTQVGEPSAPSYSNPDSEARNPQFDLHMGWRGI